MPSDGAVRSDGGRAFHAHVAAAGNARSPSVKQRVVGLRSVSVSAERRRRRESTLVTGRRDSDKYGDIMIF